MKSFLSQFLLVTALTIGIGAAAASAMPKNTDTHGTAPTATMVNTQGFVVR